jgi:5-enolpyruvylshikimate-3-phosphate synthase
MTTEKKKLKIKCDIYWAQLSKMNEMSGAYQVNLCNLSDAAVEALEEMGISVNQDSEKKADMGRYITCKSKNKPMKAFDVDGDEVTEDIGNGSKA